MKFVTYICTILLIYAISSLASDEDEYNNKIKKELSTKLESFSDKYCNEDSEFYASEIIKTKCSKFKQQQELNKESDLNTSEYNKLQEDLD